MRLSLTIHRTKKGIRALGVAESFRPTDRRSTLAGVVMRSDLLVDGFAFGGATVGGEDATSSVLRLYRRLHREDVNLVMLAGCIISLYNIIDLDLLAAKVGVPVLCLTHRESKGVEEAMGRHFDDPASRLAQYAKLGTRTRVVLRTGQPVYVRRAGMSDDEARHVLDAFTLQGGIPEPVRVARLLARACQGAFRSATSSR